MFVKPRSAFVGCPSVVCSSSGSAKNARYARLLPSTRKSSASRAGPSSRTSSSPVSVFGTPATLVLPATSATARARPTAQIARDHRSRSGSHGSAAWMATVRRVPLLSGSRIVHVPLGDDDVVLRPPPPPTRVVDVAGAVRDALRFPLDGAPLADARAQGGARRPSSSSRPRSRCPEHRPTRGARRSPRSSTSSRRCGIRDERQTLLVAGGLSRKLAHRDLERLLPPPQARAFRGRVVVHDAADPDLVPVTSKTDPRRASTAPWSTPTSWSSSRPPRPCPTAALLRCSRPATPRRSAAAPRRTRSSRPPASRCGSLRSESRRHSARAFRCSESHSPSITRG